MSEEDTKYIIQAIKRAIVYDLTKIRLNTRDRIEDAYVSLDKYEALISSDKYMCPICRRVEGGDYRYILHTSECPNRNRNYAQYDDILPSIAQKEFQRLNTASNKRKDVEENPVKEPEKRPRGGRKTKRSKRFKRSNRRKTNRRRR
jgi:hypothetical protein